MCEHDLFNIKVRYGVSINPISLRKTITIHKQIEIWKLQICIPPFNNEIKLNRASYFLRKT